MALCNAVRDRHSALEAYKGMHGKPALRWHFIGQLRGWGAAKQRMNSFPLDAVATMKHTDPCDPPPFSGYGT